MTEYFVAEIPPDFDRHADVIKFFRSLSLPSSYFLQRVAFGAELTRLLDVEKKCTRETRDVACGPDAPSDFKHSTASPNVAEVICLESEDGEEREEQAVKSFEERKTAHIKPASSGKDDWRWLCEDCSSSDDDFDSDIMEVEDGKPIDVVLSEQTDGATTSRPKITTKRFKHDCSAAPSTSKKVASRIKCECKLCGAVKQFNRPELFHHATAHMHRRWGARFRCRDCAYKAYKYHKIQKHTCSEDHGFEDRTLGDGEPKYISECVRIYRQCYPGVDFPRKMESIMKQLGLDASEIDDRKSSKIPECSSGSYDPPRRSFDAYWIPDSRKRKPVWRESARGKKRRDVYSDE